MGANEDWEIKRRKYPARITRAKAIKLYCKEECCAGELSSQKECSFSACFLWPFRLGRETLAKPNSFKKQRKSRVFPDKNRHPVVEMKVQNTDLEIYDKLQEEELVLRVKNSLVRPAQIKAVGGEHAE